MIQIKNYAALISSYEQSFILSGENTFSLLAQKECSKNFLHKN
jgi:hypothetical protein